MLIKLQSACLLLAVVATTAFSQQPSNRIALVIGVQNYSSVPPLRHSLNDAHDIAAMLTAKQFQVIELYDPKTKRELQDAVRQYFTLLQGKSNATGMVYYSGHGMQVDGSNYLIPTLADPQIKADLDDQCLNIDYVMQAIAEAGNSLNICVLDACRNNPFRSFSRSAEKGLSMVNTPKGSYVVYATKPGSVASDGTGRNGLFTSKLLKYVNTEGLNIEQVFKKVAADVSAESGDAQRPWIASDYTGDFYFTPGSANTQLATVEIKKETSEKREGIAFPSFDYGYGPADAATVTIGSQIWIAKNLSVSHFANGDLIPEAKTADEWKTASGNQKPAWCYYNNDATNGRIYGKLYNWYAINDPRGLVPKGWHIPVDAEWTVLTDLLGGITTAGLSMKSITGWLENGNGNDHSGITCLPGGARKSSGAFNVITKSGFWWSSTENDINDAWGRYLYCYGSDVGRDFHGKGCGFSVRCIKD